MESRPYAKAKRQCISCGKRHGNVPPANFSQTLGSSSVQPNGKDLAETYTDAEDSWWRLFSDDALKKFFELSEKDVPQALNPNRGTAAEREAMKEHAEACAAAAIKSVGPIPSWGKPGEGDDMIPCQCDCRMINAILGLVIWKRAVCPGLPGVAMQPLTCAQAAFLRGFLWDVCCISVEMLCQESPFETYKLIKAESSSRLTDEHKREAYKRPFDGHDMGGKDSGKRRFLARLAEPVEPEEPEEPDSAE